MYFNKIGIASVCFATAVSILSCTSPSSTLNSRGAEIAKAANQEDLGATYQELAKSGGNLFSLEPAKSAVKIVAFRSGALSRLGHNHVLSAPEFKGYFYVPSGEMKRGRFDLEFRLDKLELDNAALRAKAGAAFSSVLTPEAINSTREHMLGDSNLQAAQFPFVRVRSLQISGEAPKFSAKIQVEMHGQRREMWVPLDVEGLPEHLSVAGSLILRQTDYGVTPYSLMGGMLSIEDEVIVDFQLMGSPQLPKHSATDSTH